MPSKSPFIFFDKKFCGALFICKFAIPFGEVCNTVLHLTKKGWFFKIVTY